MEFKSQLKRKVIILIAFLLVILGSFIGYYIYVDSFNNTLRTFDEQSPLAGCVVISPRSGQTDSWAKNVEENGTTVPYYGTIYDITLTNSNLNIVSDWRLRINITEDCYINNAWCGKFEIHQMVGDVENIQTVDLRNYDVSKLTLNYRLEESDLMIPLSSGDYMIYYPDIVADEYPIPARINDNTTSTVVGIIMYTLDNRTLTFNDYEVYYHLNMMYTNSPLFIILLVLVLIWIIMFFVFAATDWSMRNAHKRFIEDDRIIRQSIGVFTHFFEAKDIYTNGHSQRVANYSRIVAERIGLPEDKCRQIYYIGLMHDCGKCYIPDEVLKKKGKLTDEEYDIIKSHTTKGAEMIHDFTTIKSLCDGVLSHHERYDGTGYPNGLAGKEIPLVARIICVCDSFDAMNSKRCYRDKLTKEYIINEFTVCSGKQFDPKITAAFLKLIEEGKITV